MTERPSGKTPWVGSKMKKVRLIEAERIPYPEALDLMRGLAEVRSRKAEGPETLIVTQHEPVFTLGRRAGREDILVPSETLEKMGISVHKIERGGLITYHGPGQLVAYPVIKLSELGLGVVDFVRKLEEIILSTLARFQVSGALVEGHPGVWVGRDKIASIGLAVRRGVCFHGLSLNVNPDRSHFRLINPCGLDGTHVATLSEASPRPVEPGEAARTLIETFAEVLKIDLEPWSLSEARDWLVRNRPEPRGSEKQQGPEADQGPGLSPASSGRK